MSDISYGVFFEKISAWPNPIDFGNILKRSMRFSILSKRAVPALEQAIVKKPSTLGKVMGVGMPVVFMGSEGMNTLDKNRRVASNTGTAKNLPQTMNPWQTF